MNINIHFNEKPLSSSLSLQKSWTRVAMR